MENKKIEEIIDLYHLNKMENDEYKLQLKEKIDVNVIDLKTNKINKIKTDIVSTNHNFFSKPYEVLKKENIDLLDPDKIDIKFFWRYINKVFPLYSISQYPECKTEEDVNKSNLNACKWTGFYSKIDLLLSNKPNSKVLEIGPGYGNLFKDLTDRYNNLNYYAVDINKLFYYDGLYECDGKSIPKEAGQDFDLIFSFGTFNHMSKNQRSSYYLDIYKKLKKSGKFIFNNFLISEHNQHRNDFWSYQDDEGNVYSSFFSQLILIDDYNSLANELNEIGFSVKVNLSQNLAVIECEKQ